MFGDLFNQTHISELDRISGLTGFVNFGNTCYMNAVFQLLAHCSPLADFLYDFVPTEHNTNLMNTTNQFSVCIKRLWSPAIYNFISPWKLVYVLRSELQLFDISQQQDAQEFLRAFLEIMHRELASSIERRLSSMATIASHSGHAVPKVPEIDATIISDLFQGQMVHKIICSECSTVSTCEESFLDLSIPVKRDDRRFHYDSDFKQNGMIDMQFDDDDNPFRYKREILMHKMNDCMNTFFENSILKNENQYSCSKCKKMVNATKTLKIKRLPEMLCVHFKRFRTEAEGIMKISTHIEFPVDDLDMREFAEASELETKYELIGAIVHEGYTGECGHYVCYSKHEVDGNWYLFNDITATKVDVSRVLQSQAYVLLYKKRSDGLALEKSAMVWNNPKNDVERKLIQKLRVFENAYETDVIESAQEGPSTSKRSKMSPKVDKRCKVLRNGDIEFNSAQKKYHCYMEMIKELAEQVKENKKSNVPTSSKSDLQFCVQKMFEEVECCLEECLKKDWVNLEKQAIDGIARIEEELRQNEEFDDEYDADNNYDVVYEGYTDDEQDEMDGGTDSDGSLSKVENNNN